jgi:hypothetical protein
MIIKNSKKIWKGYQNELHILVSLGWIFRPLCKMLVVYSYLYHYYIPKNYKSCVVGIVIARHGIQGGGKFVFPKYTVFQPTTWDYSKSLF